MTAQEIRAKIERITAAVGQKGNTMDNKKYYYLEDQEAWKKIYTTVKTLTDEVFE